MNSNFEFELRIHSQNPESESRIRQWLVEILPIGFKGMGYRPLDASSL
jgi:hypothetical protein